MDELQVFFVVTYTEQLIHGGGHLREGDARAQRTRNDRLRVYEVLGGG